MQLMVYTVTIFCLGMPEMQVSHICIQEAEINEDPNLGWREVVRYIIGYYFNRYSLLIIRHYFQFLS